MSSIREPFTGDVNFNGHPTFVPLHDQVGGHQDKIMVSSDGDVIIKTCAHNEAYFYTKLGPKLDEDLIGHWTPKFYGILKLQGRLPECKAELDPLISGAGGVANVTESLNLEKVPEGESPKEAMVLENIARHFARANILDIKLGTKLYGDSASAEKKALRNALGAQTTSTTKGARIVGFKVWNETTQAYDITGRAYGKSIQDHQLIEGIRKALPNNQNLPAELFQQVLRLILARVKRLRAAVQDYEWRIRGSSILIVHEGHAESLRKTLLERKVGEDESDPDSDEDTEQDEDETEAVKGFKAFDVRLIDFAHASEAPGEGSDEGYNLGLTTVVELLEERLADFKSNVGES